MKRKYHQALTALSFFAIFGISSFLLMSTFLTYAIGTVSEKYSLEVITLEAGESLNTIIYGTFLTFSILSLPLMVLYAYHYLKDALYKSERRFALSLMTIPIFMSLGALFGYWATIYVFIHYLYGFNAFLGVNDTIQLWKLGSIILTNMFMFGVVFLTPFIVRSLITYNIMKKETLRALAMPFAVFSFTLAAILTPTDVISTFLLSGPMSLLYVISLY